MTTYDTGNGQSDVKHDGNPDPKPDEKPTAKQDEASEPKKLTLTEQKAQWAREAEATRVGLQAEIDQLQAEIVTIETIAGTQVAEIEADIKQLRAEMRNIGTIHEKAEKVVTVPGPAAVVAPKAPKKGRGR